MSVQEVLEERYGAPAPWRRRALLAACAVVVASFLGWLAWAAWAQATPRVSSELVAFEVVDDHTAKARVDVRFDGPGVEATCVLRAYAEDHTLVGEVAYSPSTDGIVQQRVRTERRATAVENVGCTAPGQSRSR